MGSCYLVGSEAGYFLGPAGCQLLIIDSVLNRFLLITSIFSTISLRYI